MNNPSQSGHSNASFALHWFERPELWLEAFETLRPTESKKAWEWLVSQHQLLTLAKRTEHDPRRSVLWFRVSHRMKTDAILLGAVLPDERVALIRAPNGDVDGVADFLRSRLKIASTMGTAHDLAKLGFVLPETRLIEQQIAWGKSLLTTAARSPFEVRTDLEFSPRNSIRVRRATETHRTTLQRWARVFAIDTASTGRAVDIVATQEEVAGWMKRGRLLVFECPTPFGMAALSGNFDDSRFGRSCRLSLIFVDPIYRGRGFGREIVRILESEARLENAKLLVLYSDESNERATKFYAGLGFQKAPEWIEAKIGGTGAT